MIDKKIEALTNKIKLIRSGYAGISRDGSIIDRRKEKGVPIQENKIIGSPKPKKIETGKPPSHDR